MTIRLNAVQEAEELCDHEPNAVGNTQPHPCGGASDSKHVDLSGSRTLAALPDSICALRDLRRLDARCDRLVLSSAASAWGSGGQAYVVIRGMLASDYAGVQE